MWKNIYYLLDVKKKTKNGNAGLELIYILILYLFYDNYKNYQLLFVLLNSLTSESIEVLGIFWTCHLYDIKIILSVEHSQSIGFQVIVVRIFCYVWSFFKYNMHYQSSDAGRLH